MKSFLLLILSLMTGCEASDVVNGCREGWVEFIFKYPDANGNYQKIDLLKADKLIIGSIRKDVWENKGRLHLHHDTKNRQFNVIIKQLQQEDFGEYSCELYGTIESSPERVNLGWLFAAGYQQPFNQTAYRKAKTTISCEDNGNKDDFRVRFFCKENGPICEDVLSTKSALRSNGSFTLTETERGFTVSISDVSAQHAGVYWWGVESTEGSYRAALRRIQLKVEAHIKSFTRSPTIGQRITYWCEYPEGAPKERFICKGEDPSLCERVVSTAQNTGRFSMTDETVKRNITITVTDVTAGDSGTYWCGAESETETQRQYFYHRLVMTVVPSTTSSPSSSKQPATVSSYGFDRASVLEIALALSLDVMLVMLAVYLGYRGCAPCKRTEEYKAKLTGPCNSNTR